MEVTIKQSNGDQAVAIIWFKSDQLDQNDHWQAGAKWQSGLILIREIIPSRPPLHSPQLSQESKTPV